MSPSLQDSHAIHLPQRLDTPAYETLKNLLLDATADNNTAPIIDASNVTYLGGLCLELLLSSGLKISSYSEELAENLHIFGVFETLVLDEARHV